MKLLALDAMNLGNGATAIGLDGFERAQQDSGKLADSFTSAEVTFECGRFHWNEFRD